MSRGRSARSPRGGGARLRWPEGVRRLDPEELRWTCDPASLRKVVEREARAAKAEAKALAKQEPDPRARARLLRRRRLSERPEMALDEVIGQERAVAAIACGLSSEAPGFHVFVAGPRGSGRRALVRAALAEYRPPFPRPRDRLYVANFEQPSRPRLLTLPRGKGRRFKKDLDDMLVALRRSIPVALQREQHLARCDRFRRKSDADAMRFIEELSAELRLEGFVVGPVPDGLGTPELRLDLGEGPPVSFKSVERRLESGELKSTRALKRCLSRHPAAQARLEEAAGQARRTARQGALALRRLEGRVARGIAQGFADDLALAYPTAAVRRWLDTLLEAVGRELELFLEREDERSDGEDAPRRSELEGLDRFRANLFVDARESEVPPVIFEPSPSVANLFGSVDGADGVPEHARLRAGTLFQATGGVVVVDAADLFQERAAWRALKRAVKSGWLEVARAGGNHGNLRPEPVRTAFKLVAVGSDELYEALAYDPDFAAVFKVKVQFESIIPRTKKTVADTARALARLARRAGLRPPDAGALARLVERSCRLAGRHDRLHPGFAEFLDLLQEADRLLEEEPPAGSIGAAHIDEALARRRARHDLGERHNQELLDDGIVLLSNRGRRVGVVNALVVYDEGVHLYSRPTRVTAAVGLGRQGLVDIEREVSFSGDSHHKGVAIIGGILRERFAQDKPLCLTASVCFEQSYSPIDGDSASLAELLAVLSALSDLPLDQGWGVTGSINQKGEVQAIGDVSAKVEGFFDLCRTRGLNGRQGVVIPEANVRDLMLREDVVAAVAKGRFHVVAVRELDEALELLTGVPAGARPGVLGPFPTGSVNARVDARLLAYAEAARRFERGAPGA